MQSSRLINPRSMHVVSRKLLFEAIQGQFDWEVAKELYVSVRETLNPTGTFGEDEGKSSFQDYFYSAWNLHSSMSTSGFKKDPEFAIPIDVDGALLDGAHRAACALALGLEPVTQQVSKPGNSVTFESLESLGMTRRHLDMLGEQYLISNPTTRYLIRFGDQNDFQFVRSAINKLGVQSVYSHYFALTEKGRKNMLFLSYGHHEWFDLDSLERLYVERFNNSSVGVGIFLLDSDWVDVPSLKQRLREKVPGFERIIHSSDDYFDTARLSTVLNESGRHWVNNGDFAHSTKLIEEMGGRLIENKQAREAMSRSNFISGSSCLEVYGLRTARDRDPIKINSNSAFPAGFKSHNTYLEKHGILISNILHDPSNYIRIEGHKILSLPAFLRIKATDFLNPKISDLGLVTNFIETGSLPIREKRENGAIFFRRGCLRVRINASRAYETLMRLLPNSLENTIRNTLRRIVGRG